MFFRFARAFLLESPEGQGIGIAHGDEMLGQQDKHHLGPHGPALRDAGDDYAGHEQSTLSVIDPGEFLDLAHFLPRGNIDAKLLLDAASSSAVGAWRSIQAAWLKRPPVGSDRGSSFCKPPSHRVEIYHSERPEFVMDAGLIAVFAERWQPRLLGPTKNAERTWPACAKDCERKASESVAAKRRRLFEAAASRSHRARP